MICSRKWSNFIYESLANSKKTCAKVKNEIKAKRLEGKEGVEKVRAAIEAAKPQMLGFYEAIVKFGSADPRVGEPGQKLSC